MPYNTWDLALAELIFYVPTALPLLFCMWRHGRDGLVGWVFLTGFVALQLAGSGMTLGAGQHGTPSTTAVIITEIGLSPLLLGIAGLIHEWVLSSHLASKAEFDKQAWLVTLIYHVLVVGAVVLYAIGASGASHQPPTKNSKTLWEVGIVLLALLWLAQCAVFGLLARTLLAKGPKTLAWTIGISLALFSIRIIYQVVATVATTPSFNPVTGSIVFRAVLEFVPSALIVFVCIVGGVLSVDKIHASQDRIMAMRPLREASGSEISV